MRWTKVDESDSPPEADQSPEESAERIDADAWARADVAERAVRDDNVPAATDGPEKRAVAADAFRAATTADGGEPDALRSSQEALEGQVEPPTADAISKARRHVEAAYQLGVVQGEIDDAARPTSGEDDLGQDSDPDLAVLPIADLREVSDGDGHTHEAYRVELVDGTVGYLKPQGIAETEERFAIPAGTEYLREAAASDFDQAVGLHVVPETVVRHEDQLPFPNASFQVRAPDEAQPLHSYSPQDQQAMAVLDYVLANSDRHSNNYRTFADGGPAAIDNGFCLPTSNVDGIRSDWVVQEMHQPLDHELVEKLLAVDVPGLQAKWSARGIEAQAIDGALNRLREVQRGQIDGTTWTGKIMDSYWRTYRNRV